MENKLETLKNLVADWFNSAENKSDIEKLTVINKAVDEAKAEHDKLTAENKELLKDYKELVVHTSFSDKHNQPTDPIGGNAISFEEALQTFLNNK